MRHTHKQEKELQTCVCTSSYFHHLFTNPCWGRTWFFLNIFFILFILFYSIYFILLILLIYFIYLTFSFLVVFVLYDFTISLVVFHLYNELRHTHKQEKEIQTFYFLLCHFILFYFFLFSRHRSIWFYNFSSRLQSL